MKLIINFLKLLFLSEYTTAFIRWKRQTGLLVEEGLDIPITLRSLITCLTPGIREHLCLGPRVEVMRKERIGLSERRGFANGYHNGVDIRLLRPLDVPLIKEETEIGHHIGAVTDVTKDDGVVEFGDRLKVFKAWQQNNGGIVEWDRHGAGVDIGSRASAADDLLKLKWTIFGVNVGPTSSRTLVGPNTVGYGKGSAIKTGTTLSTIYNGYYNQPGDWYKNQFKKPMDEFRTPAQRACPWCFAVDSTYPVQRLFP